MWAWHHRSRWEDLDRLEESRDDGRYLDQGGFILVDPFDTRLRQLSEAYLHAAWARLSGVLEQAQVVPPEDLSWGSLHPGVATLSRLIHTAPGDFVGWTSPRLGDFDRDSRFQWVNKQLRNGSPALYYGASYRSHKWRIAPDDAKQALRLIEALSTDEVSEWAPAVVLEHTRKLDTNPLLHLARTSHWLRLGAGGWLLLARASYQLHRARARAAKGAPKAEAGPWLDLARAILAENQQEVDRAFASAKAAYSPVGYRIVVRGYRAYLTQPGMESKIQLPDEPA